MNSAFWIALARQSLSQPRAAAQVVMDHKLTRDALWTALALIAAINTLSLQFVLSSAETRIPLPGYFHQPLALFVLLAGILVIYVHVLFWSGLTVGGRGKLDDMIALIVWLQALRAAGQIAVLVLSLALPPLGFVLAVAIAFWGLWILLNFIAAGLNLPTVFHAIAVLAIACVGLVFGLGILMSLIGLVAQGV